jgi:hypothetical protein
MTESTSETVECPICGVGFDPMAAGGWCTNPECGEWQYLGDEVPESPESTPTDDPVDPDGDDAVDSDGDDDVDPSDAVDEWVQPSTDTGPTHEAATDGEEDPDTAATADADSGEAASTDEELTLEFGTAPGAADDESAEEGASNADETAGETGEPSAGAEEAETAACPDCGADVRADARFCPDCGTDLDADASPLKTCPSCGEEVGAGDAFCSACGTDLEAAESSGSSPQGAAPERLALAARGEEVLVSPDQTVGREIRRIVTETGGDEDDAVLIHREHVRFVHEDGQFYLVDLGDNPTELNGSRLSKGDREPVEPGDELALSDVVTLSVERA